MPRLTVNFFHIDKGDELQWAWYDAGYTPAIGEFIITPKKTRWIVKSVTWQMHHSETLHCNVLVEDYKNE